jgi:AcrR family transcriptional regulator
MKHTPTNWLRGKQTPEKGPRWADEAISDSGQAAKRQAILTAAAKLFKERGYDRVRLDDIADALNVTKPSLYYHVGNKEQILVDIRRLWADQIQEGFEELFESDRSGADLLALLLARYGESVTTDLGICVLRHFQVELSPKSAKSLREIERRYERKVKLIFERGIADGSLKPCNIPLVFMAMFGSLHWLAFWYEPQRARLSPSEISKLYVEVFLQGVETKPNAARTPLTSLEAGLRSTRR